MIAVQFFDEGQSLEDLIVIPNKLRVRFVVPQSQIVDKREVLFAIGQVLQRTWVDHKPKQLDAASGVFYHKGLSDVQYELWIESTNLLRKSDGAPLKAIGLFLMFLDDAELDVRLAIDRLEQLLCAVASEFDWTKRQTWTHNSENVVVTDA
ncbi:hypothetical protein [Alicyclobacillus sendaiensis]|uniref:Uncharacterized protein n=1 Tax=Alicyclobacillus sendaiensis PA2 TaxID=3029425 RepID=A0ABT6Y148_ALISE|nr:hypothetical protein [Alicyclobacillus sendaiensis]MDI9261048.1 hypothetical protein [Alicyclobacillus sendaiensis PA2]